MQKARLVVPCKQLGAPARTFACEAWCLEASGALKAVQVHTSCAKISTKNRRTSIAFAEGASEVATIARVEISDLASVHTRTNSGFGTCIHFPEVLVTPEAIGVIHGAALTMALETHERHTG